MTTSVPPGWHTTPGWSTAHLIRPGARRALSVWDRRTVPVTSCGKAIPDATPATPDMRQCGQCARRRTTTTEET